MVSPQNGDTRGRPPAPPPLSNATATEHGFKNFLGKRQMSSFVLWPSDEHEVIEILAGLSNNKSPSYIDIPVTLIKRV